MVNSDELIGTAEYLTLYTRCRINLCRYKLVLLYFIGTSLFKSTHFLT